MKIIEHKKIIQYTKSQKDTKIYIIWNVELITRTWHTFVFHIYLFIIIYI